MMDAKCGTTTCVPAQVKKRTFGNAGNVLQRYKTGTLKTFVLVVNRSNLMIEPGLVYLCLLGL